MASRLVDVRLSEAEINHILNLILANADDGDYSGPRDAYWKRSALIAAKLEEAVSGDCKIERPCWRRATPECNPVRCEFATLLRGLRDEPEKPKCCEKWRGYYVFRAANLGGPTWVSPNDRERALFCPECGRKL